MSVFVSDSYTEGGTGVISLNSHVGELGANPWTQHPHANYSGGPMQLDADLDRAYSGGTAASYASAVPPSADYYAQSDFILVTAISQNIAPCARMDTTADTMYFGRLNNGTAWQLFKRVTGTSTQLGSDSTTNLPTAGGAAVSGRVVCNGDQISFMAGGVTVIGPITDTAITAAGRVGVRNSGAASATTGAHLDNLEAGTLDAPAVGHGSFVINNLRPAIFKPGRPR